MSTAPIVSDLQKANPSAIIEMFTLTTDATLHGSATTYRFHNGTNALLELQLQELGLLQDFLIMQTLLAIRIHTVHQTQQQNFLKKYTK
jgi:hypothetical protein